MKKIKVVSIMRGISKKSGKPYTRLVLKGIREDGTSCVSDFFITENVYEQLMKEGIQEESYISVELGFDSNFHSNITDIFIDSQED